MAEPGRLPSMVSHRVGHNWSNLAAAAELSCFFNNQIIANSEILYKKYKEFIFPWSQIHILLSAFSYGLYSIIIPFYKN